MYVILANEDNTISAPVKERIVQRSKLVDTLWILSQQYYKGYDMTDATAVLEYILPVSRKYRTEILERADDMYEEYLKYILPVDTMLTAEAGDIEIQLSFILADIDINGDPIQRVRKLSPAYKITVVPISAWSDIIPDSALSALDQRIIKVDAQIKAIENMNQTICDSKADGLKYDTDTNVLQLLSGVKEIGNAVKLKECGGTNEDGVPAVDFSNINVLNPDDAQEYNNVIEF